MFPKREEYQWRPSPMLCKRFDLIDPYMGKVVLCAFSPAVFFLICTIQGFSLLYFLFFSLSLPLPPLPFSLPSIWKRFSFLPFSCTVAIYLFFLPFFLLTCKICSFLFHMLQIMIIIAIDIRVQSSYIVLVYLYSCSVRLEA
jgi:hypothetical protein